MLVRCRTDQRKFALVRRLDPVPKNLSKPSAQRPQSDIPITLTATIPGVAVSINVTLRRTGTFVASRCLQLTPDLYGIGADMVEVRCPTNSPVPTAIASRSSIRMTRRMMTLCFAGPAVRFSAHSINFVDISSDGHRITVLSQPVARAHKFSRPVARSHKFSHRH